LDACANIIRMDLDAPNLANNTVRLEPFGHEHRQALFDSGAVDAMWKWMPVIGAGTNYDAYYDHILKRQKIGDIVPFVIFRQSDNAFAGVAGFLDPNRTHRRVRIGYIWHPKDMRGAGIFAATQILMIQRALDWRAKRLEWHVSTKNDRALAACRRLGAREEGVMRSYQRMTDGDWADVTVFSMLRPEAQAAVKLLEDRIAEAEEA